MTEASRAAAKAQRTPRQTLMRNELITRLNVLVTNTIVYAEDRSSEGVEAVRRVYADISTYEEMIAMLIDEDDVEGRIARYGAYRAALKANDVERARDLAKRYGIGTDGQLPDPARSP